MTLQISVFILQKRTDFLIYAINLLFFDNGVLFQYFLILSFDLSLKLSDVVYFGLVAGILVLKVLKFANEHFVFLGQFILFLQLDLVSLGL